MKSMKFWMQRDWLLLGMHFPGCSQCSQLGTAGLEQVPTHTTKHSDHHMQPQVWFALDRFRRQPHTVEKLSAPTGRKMHSHADFCQMHLTHLLSLPEASQSQQLMKDSHLWR